MEQPMYPVQPAPKTTHGAACPMGWKIILDHNGNPVYVRDRT
jgi:hypothetical protein